MFIYVVYLTLCYVNMYCIVMYTVAIFVCYVLCLLVIIENRCVNDGELYFEYVADQQPVC